MGEIHRLTQGYRSGTPAAFDAFRDLVSLLLNHTVMADGSAVRLIYGPGARARQEPVLGGWNGPDDPVRLTNGLYLKLLVSLYLEDTPEGRRCKVRQSSFQYQIDPEGERWVFRYDYLRTPPEPHPGMHVQVRGRLSEPDCLPVDRPLERVHFPTNRISLEAVIRLLIEQFELPPRSPDNIWRPLLASSEAAFLEIAHRAISGPPH